nr:MAG TPA: hypothetical protein [Caudoviricetes sp.]
MIFIGNDNRETCSERCVFRNVCTIYQGRSKGSVCNC